MTNELKMKKMTKKDCFNALLNIKEVGTNENLVAFIEHELELLEKKSNSAKNGEKKPTAKQSENEALKDAIYNNMEENRLYSITEMQKEFAECAELSNQKMSALLRLMIEEKRVERIVDKRKTYFSKIISA